MPETSGSMPASQGMAPTFRCTRCRQEHRASLLEYLDVETNTLRCADCEDALEVVAMERALGHGPQDAARHAVRLVQLRLDHLGMAPPREWVREYGRNAWRALRNDLNGSTLADVLWSRALAGLYRNRERPDEQELADWADAALQALYEPRRPLGAGQ